MKNQNKTNKCEHKELERTEMIQEGYSVRGYTCKECGEWIEDDFNPFEYEFSGHFTS